ncbi:hypothetical protein GCM10022419_063540 [Nonomuraea rosea]|uniref:Uncharacterized protein n=1 Tax=Nonomuraea rosea TaxID=638574 RepID=A0ABP6XWV4_9ACTN
MDSRIIDLPEPAVAAATDGSTVWCAAGGRLLAFDRYGSPVGSVPAPRGLRSLAAVAGTLVAAGAALSWLDPGTGEPRESVPAGPGTVVLAGGGAVWAADRASQRAWPLPAAGVRGTPIETPGLDACAPDGDHLWWTTHPDPPSHGDPHSGDPHPDPPPSGGAVLWGGPEPVALGPVRVGAMVVCAGVVWMGAEDALLTVNAWSGVPIGGSWLQVRGPVTALACANGVLAGGGPAHGIFVLDPAKDEGPRYAGAGTPGTPGTILACPPAVWALSADRPAALVIPQF